MARIATPPAPAPPAGASALETRFRLRERGTSPRIEFLARLTTFFTMAYIIFVNTDIMKVTGMDPVALTIGTIIAAAVPTLMLALWADLPWALAPGMGYNALFAYTRELSREKCSHPVMHDVDQVPLRLAASAGGLARGERRGLRA